MNEEIEVWKDVVGYEGYYIVSNLGKVHSVERECIQFNGLTGNYNSRILKAGPVAVFEDKDGYLKVKLNKSGNRKNHMIHRLVAIAFILNLENKPEVNHKSGNKKDNRACSLEWTTSSENQIHAIKNNLYECQKGETNGMAKLTEEQVRKIHELSLNGLSKTKISSMFDVNYTAIQRILNGTRWKHIYKELFGV